MSREPEVLGEGRFLRLLRRDGWELAERPGIAAIAVVVAVTPGRELLLVEQYREPVRCRTLELPAGLVGDEPGRLEETLEEGAQRELLEETGWSCRRVEVLSFGATSAGMSSEVVTLVWAEGLTRHAGGGGAGEEDIAVHAVPLATAPSWLRRREREGLLVDPKVWAALWFAAQRA